MFAREDFGQQIDLALRIAGVNPDADSTQLLRGVLEQIAHTAPPVDASGEFSILLQQLAEATKTELRDDLGPAAALVQEPHKEAKAKQTRISD